MFDSFDSSFTNAGGQIAIISLIFCFSPYFTYHPLNWENAKDTDPIKLGLQSRYYELTLVAVISASIPPILDLFIHIFWVHSDSAQNYFSALSVLLCNVVPQLLILVFVMPSSDTRLFICIYSANTVMILFAVSNFLCEYGKKFWRNKWFTFAVSIIYIAVSTVPSTAYFSPVVRFWIQNFFALMQCAGATIFFHFSYKFFTVKKTHDNKEDEETLENELSCKFAIASLLFGMISIATLYTVKGFGYWTQQGMDYLVSYTLLTSAPNLAMSMLLTQLTRNRAYVSQKVKQMFVRYISHEMRTPLNTAVMGLQYLRSEFLKSCRDTELLGIVDEVRDACEISVTILNEMLDYDKLQSGGMKLEKEEIEVKDFLETTISPFYVHANQKDITLTCNMDSLSSTCSNSLLLFIDADRNKFAQVIRNLISNALKFTPPGGTVEVVTTVHRHGLENQQHPRSSYLANNQTNMLPSTVVTSTTSYLLRIDVIDSGAGVSKENQKRLFKEIVQFNPGKLQSGGGSGLGLYISKGIMDLHEGSGLTIASEGEGRGCTFTATLPAKLQQLPTRHTYEEQKTVEKVDCEGGHVPITLFHRVSSIQLAEGRSLKGTLSTLYSSKTDHRGSTKSLSASVAPLNVGGGLPPGNSTQRRKEFAECQSFSYDGEESSPSSLGLKVLVVDDSTSNRKMLVRLLRDRCRLIHQAEDGEDAVRQVRAGMEAAAAAASPINSNVTSPATSSPLALFDVVLMDFIMPNMEGPEAARAMRDLGFAGLIIGITGNVLQADRDRFTGQGADIVLTKPVDIRDINRAFRLIHKSDYS